MYFKKQSNIDRIKFLINLCNTLLSTTSPAFVEPTCMDYRWLSECFQWRHLENNHLSVQFYPICLSYRVSNALSSPPAHQAAIDESNFHGGSYQVCIFIFALRIPKFTDIYLRLNPLIFIWDVVLQNFIWNWSAQVFKWGFCALCFLSSPNT